MDDQLKDHADKFELPLKPGAWEEIVPNIPIYPGKKRRFFLFFLPHTIGLILGVSVILVAGLFIPEITKIAGTKGISSEIPQQKTESITPQANDTFLSETHTKVTTSKNSLAHTPQVISDHKPLDAKSSSNHIISIKDINANHSFKNDFELRSIGTFNQVSNSNNLYSFGSDIETFLKINGLKAFIINIDNDEASINSFKIKREGKDSLKSNFKSNSQYQTSIFAAVSLLNNRLIVDPELMKLPNGKGQEYTLGLNKRKNNFSVFTSIVYTAFKQSTSMGNVFDSTYYQAFKPNFKTMMPQEYASRVHDTASLYIAGTNHNIVNQQFEMMGLSLGSAYRILNYKKFSVESSYTFTYRLLRKANTFFYDSINRVAVPFSQADKGIVFRNLLSSRIGLNLHYQFNSIVGLQIGGFYDHYHSAFIKHYYKAKIRNYGLQIGLNFRIDN